MKQQCIVTTCCKTGLRQNGESTPGAARILRSHIPTNHVLPFVDDIFHISPYP